MTPFGFIAHRDGYWHAVIAAEGFTPRQLARDLGELAAQGLTVTPCADRPAYIALLDSLKGYHESPEYLAKKASHQEGRGR